MKKVLLGLLTLVVVAVGAFALITHLTPAEHEGVTCYTDPEADFVIHYCPQMGDEEPLWMTTEEYLLDDSRYPTYVLRDLDFSDLEPLETAEAWRQAAEEYCYSAEDVLILKAASYLNYLKLTDKTGSESVPLEWLTKSEDFSFDFSEVNENRLRYKLEILGHKYGFTTKGLSGISLESGRVWYNFYKIEASEELNLEDATIL